MVELMLGDCLERMREIPSGSVDMILCDLPYGTTACKWDSVIPFEPLWEQYRRVAKQDSAIVLTAAQPFTSALVMSMVGAFKYDWCWKKPRGTGHLNAKRQPMRDKEDILVFSFGRPRYFPQMGCGEPYSRMKGGKKARVCEAGDTVYGRFSNGADFRSDNHGVRYPKQVVEFGVVERGTIHPTQKPVALMEYLIRTYTSEGEAVLDNCMGSGTTGVACVRTGRNFIGIERDEGYFKIAQERINKELNV